MTEADFNRRFHRDLAEAEAVLLRDGELAPMIAVIGSDGRARVLAGDFRDRAAVARTVDVARLTAVASDAAYVLLRCETWVVAGGSLPSGVTPANSDRRVEAVAVAASARVGSRIEHRLSLREIVRGPNARPTALRPIAAAGPKGDGAGMPLKGWIADLLPPHRPSADQRKLAAALLTVGRAGLG